MNNDHDWTEPAHLGESDWETLKEIKRLHELGKMQGAMNVARSCDTIVREEIPPQVWLDMGGALTPTGLERLRKSKENDTGKSR
jgi:hypothetical protein